MGTETALVYKQLKKQNGEAFARVIRDAVLLDIPNIVHILEFAGNNPDEAKHLVRVIREIYKTPTTPKIHTDKNPLELLADAGYDAFVAKTEKQKNSIKKYFRINEQLCTFKDPERHKDYYIIHAIKHGAEKILPSKTPEREDEYGTSVISIQIAKHGGFISIKNRYNHSVDNPDATFNNNPDKIIPGLSESLKKYFKVDFYTSNYPLSDKFIIVKDQIIRFNSEFYNHYIGSDFVVHNSNIIRLNNDYQILLWIFVLNIKTGEVNIVTELYGCTYKYDEGSKELNEFFRNKKIKIEKNPKNKKEKTIYADGIKVAKIVDGDLTELHMPGVKSVGDYFLSSNTSLQSLSMPDLEQCGYAFLCGNENISTIDVPKLKHIVGPLFNEKLKRQFIILPPENQKSEKILFRLAINSLRHKLFNKSKPVLQQTDVFNR